MFSFVWWDSEEKVVSEPFVAEDFDSALDKAIWLYMGLIGEQFEYDLPITIKDIVSGKCRKWEIKVEYEQPTIHKTEL